MELFECLEKRRSIRKFEKKRFNEEVLFELLYAATLAPSWANTQVWEFVVVDDESLKEKLSETLTPGNPAKNAVKDAPYVVAFCGKKGVSGYFQGKPSTSLGDWLMFDVALSVQNFCLSATDKGLGTVIVGAFNIEKASEILGIPEDYQLVCLVPVGIPAKEGKKTPRNSPRDKLHKNGW